MCNKSILEKHIVTLDVEKELLQMNCQTFKKILQHQETIFFFEKQCSK